MRVFLSWSGDLSKEVAKAFHGFLKRVIQNAQPWASADTNGIPAGGVWFTEIMDKLSDSKIGVLFVTQQNKQNPWLMFEAGAIAKGLGQNRVCALLINCKHEDILPPLSQFHLSLWGRGGVMELLRTINEGLGENRLPDDVLEDSLDAHWEKFEVEVSKLLSQKPVAKPPERPDRNILVEILETVRALDARVRLSGPNSGNSHFYPFTDDQAEVFRKNVRILSMGDAVGPDKSSTVWTSHSVALAAEQLPKTGAFVVVPPTDPEKS